MTKHYLFLYDSIEDCKQNTQVSAYNLKATVSTIPCFHFLAFTSTVVFWIAAKIGITSSLLCAPVSAKSQASAVFDKNTQTNLAKMSSNQSLKMDQMGAKPTKGGQDVCFSVVNGMEFLKNPKYCKGLAFSIEERQVLGMFL